MRLSNRRGNVKPGRAGLVDACSQSCNCPDWSPWLPAWPSRQVSGNSVRDLPVLQPGLLPEEPANLICSLSCSSGGSLWGQEFLYPGCECSLQEITRPLQRQSFSLLKPSRPPVPEQKGANLTSAPGPMLSLVSADSFTYFFSPLIGGKSNVCEEHQLEVRGTGI